MGSIIFHLQNASIKLPLTNNFQAICNSLGLKVASVLSDKEGKQIYDIFTQAASQKRNFCAEDSNGQCEFPFIGLKRDSGDRADFLDQQWTDGNFLRYTDWGSGEPDSNYS